MDEVWERAVETALDGKTDCSSARTLTLDGVVKCVQGRLPPPDLLERFNSLEHLSIANVGVSTLERFPRLPNLQKLNLSDNRIAGGLEHLVGAGLDSLRDLDLSNNRIQSIDDLAPLAQLKIVSLDLYECPVTRIKDYRSRVFALIRSLKYLDKMDAEENERPESDEEEDDEEEEDDDPGSGEIDGEDRPGKMVNGVGIREGIVDADEDEESDADEEETETVGSDRAGNHLSNGFRVAAASNEGEEEEDEDVEEDDEDDDDLGEEIDEEEGEDEGVVEIHEIADSDEDEDGVEEEDEEEDVEDEEEDVDLGDAAQLLSTEGEIDGHDQGEEDENGEIGEEDEEQGVEEDGEYEEDEGEDEEDIEADYLVQPIGQADDGDDAGGSDLDVGNEDDVEEEEVDDEDDPCAVQPQPSSSQPKRKRDDDSVEDSRPSKHH
eukprot:TRINITY_DN7752_c0_g1_i1.p1 TRINITY_DN7752_c0_g1~~TRINITY_DN7752_c0_g1_i1.p1  ORF type:complete len:435 (-),score=158.95 TRINITY_DN7752_c0_g1_i1:302-1606(-)